VIGLMMTVREPARTGLIEGAKAGEGLPVKDVARFILDRRGAYLLMIFGLAFHGLLWNGATGWIPTFFIRTFGWTAPTAGFWFGLVMLVCGTGGVTAGGYAGAWLRAQGRSDANLRIAIFSCIAVLPPGIVAPLLPDATWAMAGFAIFVFFGSFPYGCAAAAFQEITPNQMRGQVTAIYFFVLNLAGIGLGPTVVALFTENVFQDVAAVKYSLACTIALAAPLSAITLALSLKHYRAVLAAEGDSFKSSA
jgi:MFS family permease